MLLFAPPPASGQTPAARDSLKTIAGDLKILEIKAHCQYQVTLNDKTILKTNCDDESSDITPPRSQRFTLTTRLWRDWANSGK
jgi:hypothetical protein